MRWALVGLIAGCAALAQVSATVEGRVLAPDGTPVANARVMIGSPSYPSVVRSGPDGRYAAGPFVADTYEIAAEAPGFARPEVLPVVTLVDGKAVTFDVKLEPEGAVAGRVTDARGNPVARPIVVVYRPAITSWGRRLVQVGSDTGPNPNGEFRIGALPPGRYYVAALPTGEGLVTFYPSSPTLAGAAPVTVVAGVETPGVHIQLSDEPTFTLRGKAIDETGRPVAGTRIRAAPRGGEMMQGGAGVTAEDGTFEIKNLIPGDYALSIQSGIQFGLVPGGAVTPLRDGWMEVRVGREDREGVEFRMRLAPSVSGAMRLEDGQPAQFQPRPQLRWAREDGAVVTTSLGEDGTFRADSLTSGRYLLDAINLPEGYFVQSVRWANREVVGQPVEFAAGMVGNLDIVISDKSATIAGTVQNDRSEPMPAALVAYWPEGGTTGILRADQHGAFRIANLRPGKYRVAAFAAGDPGMLKNPQLREAFPIDTETVETTGSGSQHVQLKLINGDRIAREAAKYP